MVRTGEHHCAKETTTVDRGQSRQVRYNPYIIVHNTKRPNVHLGLRGRRSPIDLEDIQESPKERPTPKPTPRGRLDESPR